MYLLKQSLVYLLLSFIVIVFANYTHLFIVNITMLFVYLNLKIAPAFSSSGAGLMCRKIVVLMAIPAFLTAIYALGYKLLKRKNMPYVFQVLWVLWTVLVLSVVLIR